MLIRVLAERRLVQNAWEEKKKKKKKRKGDHTLPLSKKETKCLGKSMLGCTWIEARVITYMRGGGKTDISRRADHTHVVVK